MLVEAGIVPVYVEAMTQVVEWVWDKQTEHMEILLAGLRKAGLSAANPYRSISRQIIVRQRTGCAQIGAFRVGPFAAFRETWL